MITLSRRSLLRAVATAAVGAGLVAASGLGAEARSGSTTAARTCTLVAAGDIVTDRATADATGKVAAAQNPSVVAVLGDNQYEHGSLSQYRNGYDRIAWGRLKPITRPVPGNHEYRTPGAAGYFAYFDRPAYYAYSIGCGWRGYALNSEIPLGPQVRWLLQDLVAHPNARVVAYWHRARFSSGTHHGSAERMAPLWEAILATRRRAIVLNGHEHNYERLRPIGSVHGFVVGTGGGSRYGFGRAIPQSAFRLTRTPGVLRLDLSSTGSYSWRFIDTAGTTRDSGWQRP